MANILTPINAQLPAPAFQQSSTALSAYEQLRGIRAKREEEAKERQRREIVRQLTGKAMTGDAAALQELKLNYAPEAIEYQKAMAQQQKGQYELRDLERTDDMNRRRDALRKNQILKRAIEVVENDPARYQSIVSALENNKIIPSGVLPETLPTSKEFSEFKQDVQLSEQLIESPDLAGDLGEEERFIRQMYGYGTPEYNREMQESWNLRRRAVEAEIKRNLMPRAPLVEVNPNKPTTTTRSRLQIDSVQDQLLRDSVQRVRELQPYFYDLQTWWGRARTSLARIMDRAGFLEQYSPEWHRLQAAKALFTRINRVFQPLKYMFTGAAAPLKEMEKLEQAFINTEMGPSELMFAVNEIYQMADDALRVRNEVLSRGLSPEDGEQYDKMFTELWRDVRGPLSIDERLQKGFKRVEPWTVTELSGGTLWESAPERPPGAPTERFLGRRPSERGRQDEPDVPTPPPATTGGEPPVGAIPQDAQPSPITIQPQQQTGPASPPEPGATAEGRRRLREEAERQAAEERARRQEKRQGRRGRRGQRPSERPPEERPKQQAPSAPREAPKAEQPKAPKKEEPKAPKKEEPKTPKDQPTLNKRESGEGFLKDIEEMKRRVRQKREEERRQRKKK